MAFTEFQSYFRNCFEKGEFVMKTRHNSLQVVPPVETEAPAKLTKIVPKGSIRMVFWGLRIYILLMVVLVIIGFTRGIH